MLRSSSSEEGSIVSQRSWFSVAQRRRRSHGCLHCWRKENTKERRDWIDQWWDFKVWGRWLGHVWLQAQVWYSIKTFKCTMASKSICVYLCTYILGNEMIQTCTHTIMDIPSIQWSFIQHWLTLMWCWIFKIDSRFTCGPLVYVLYWTTPWVLILNLQLIFLDEWKLWGCVKKTRFTVRTRNVPWRCSARRKESSAKTKFLDNSEGWSARNWPRNRNKKDFLWNFDKNCYWLVLMFGCLKGFWFLIHFRKSQERQHQGKYVLILKFTPLYISDWDFVCTLKKQIIKAQNQWLKKLFQNWRIAVKNC